MLEGALVVPEEHSIRIFGLEKSSVDFSECPFRRRT